MKNRELYKLELCDDCVIVYRTDKNIGRIGIVFADRFINEYNHYIPPQYILKECREMLN